MSSPITSPSGDQQEKLLHTVFEKCRIPPHHVQYIEAHGMSAWSKNLMSKSCIYKPTKHISKIKQNHSKIVSWFKIIQYNFDLSILIVCHYKPKPPVIKVRLVQINSTLIIIYKDCIFLRSICSFCSQFHPLTNRIQSNNIFLRKLRWWSKQLEMKRNLILRDIYWSHLGQCSYIKEY